MCLVMRVVHPSVVHKSVGRSELFDRRHQTFMYLHVDLFLYVLSLLRHVWPQRLWRYVCPERLLRHVNIHKGQA